MEARTAGIPHQALKLTSFTDEKKLAIRMLPGMVHVKSKKPLGSRSKQNAGVAWRC